MLLTIGASAVLLACESTTDVTIRQETIYQTPEEISSSVGTSDQTRNDQAETADHEKSDRAPEGTAE